ncbi:MAG: hypothetical protein ACOC0U_00935 [Desulfovibrionales bacterium]
MEKVRVVFLRVIINNIKYGKNSDQMVSSVLFRLETGKRVLEESAEIGQKVGPGFEKRQLEVFIPDRALEIVDRDALRSEILKYYLERMGGLQGETPVSQGPEAAPENTIIEAIKEVDIPMASAQATE